MSTRQAEDVLKHTFKQLEKMVNDVRRQKNVSPRPPKKERRDAPGRNAAAEAANKAE